MDKYCEICGPIQKLEFISNRWKCRVCTATKAKLYAIINKDKLKQSSLQRLYGITLEEYNKLFLEQQGCCKTCGTHQSELKQSLCVDHNHMTQKVRGLLCKNCNWAVGYVKENPNILEAMITYLKKAKFNAETNSITT